MKKFQCTTCFEYYSTPTTLKRHETTVHRAILPIVCPHCDSRFRDQYCLRLHLKKHISEKAKKSTDGRQPDQDSDDAGDTEWDYACDDPGDSELKPDPQSDTDTTAELLRSFAKPLAAVPRKRHADGHRRPARVSRFECYVCESAFEAGEYRMHMRDHADDLRDTKDQLTEMLQKYSSTAEKINATISSFLAQED